MGKRTVETSGDDNNALKGGERPFKPENGKGVGEFEDEFEDEFESEDEIFEAGIDGRPDEEPETEGTQSMWVTPGTLCEYTAS